MNNRILTPIVFVLTFCFLQNISAERIGHLNPYAYGVTSAVAEDMIAVQYLLNAVADSTAIVVYCDSVEVGAQVCESNAEGLHTVVVDLSSYTKGGKYTIGIRVFGTSYDAPNQLLEVAEEGGDTVAYAYGFDHPKGVDVDNNPFSPNFGRILTDEGMEVAGNWHSQGVAGIYAFDPSFRPIANGNSYCFRDNTYGYTERMTNGKYAYAPYRIRISEDGRIFVSMQDEKSSTLYELSQDLQTWTPIFSAAMADGIALDADGNYITGINCGLEVVGSGENLKIVMLNANYNAYSLFSANDFMLATYNLGTATSWSGSASTATPLSYYISSENFLGVVSSAGIAVDDHGGFWYHSGRADMINQCGLCHVNTAGEVDFEFHATAADTLKYNILPNGANGGAGCRIIKDNGEDYLYVGMGRLVPPYSGCGRMQVFKIIYNANGGVSDLELTYDKHFIGISTYLNDFALDYGHNLYVVGNSNEKIIAAAMPYSGITETPVDVSISKMAGTCGDDLTWIINDGVLTISGTGEMYDYSPWSMYRDSIDSVIISRGVTKIGDNAFSGCSNIKSIIIPDSVTSIGVGAFSYCSSLTSIIVEGGNTVYDSRNNCNAIIEIASNTLIAGCQNTIIPNSVTSIGYAAFEGCSTLTSVTIPNNVTSIEDYAFIYCSSLDTIYMMPAAPPTLDGIYVFYNNASNRVFILDGCSYDNYYTTNTSNPWYVYCDAFRSPLIDFDIDVLSNDITRGSVHIIPQQDNRSIRCDSAIVVYATAYTNYYFDHWSTGSTANPATVYLVGDSTVTAYFARNSYSVSATCNDTLLGKLTLPNGSSALYEDTLTVVAHPADHHHVVSWSGEGIVSTSDNNDTVWIKMTSDCSVNCMFAIDTLSVHVTYDYTRGSVTGGGMFVYGTPCTLAAFAYTGFTFQGWSNGINANPYIFAVLDNVELSANFLASGDVSYIITANSNDPTMGNAFVNGNAYASVMSGTNVILTAVANDGYSFVRWNDDNTESTRSVTVTNNMSFTAYFENISSVNNLEETTVKARKLWIDGQLQILLPDGTRFDATGKKIE